jgi:hypothetical protein
MKRGDSRIHAHKVFIKNKREKSTGRKTRNCAVGNGQQYWDLDDQIAERNLGTE